ncbi:hypothetical protein QQS21_004136 [Conoideocrella luteorostrata]|uniref:Uncharacterized protein n=1 Tax=Conoideocrella luteorostrata TaxID=1105319 RepID=A0AAJ0CRX2_9HYPO|nr:hypothetical protein QQS21_004136 [Conoideocrella luteorostrata]
MASQPLEVVSEQLLFFLGQAIWGWNKCSGCAADEECNFRLCPTQRLGELGRYFQFYKALTSTYVDDNSSTTRIFQTHEDLFQGINKLKLHPQFTRAEFCRALGDASAQTSPDPVELLNASTVAVRVFLMIDPSALHHSSDRLETGTFRVHWKEDVPFSKYLQDLFPTHSHPILSFVENDLFLDVTAELRATNLKKRLGITFQDTHDIRNHLRFDRRHNILEIYHYTAFIKEQLRATKDKVGMATPTKFIEACADTSL